MSNSVFKIMSVQIGSTTFVISYADVYQEEAHSLDREFYLFLGWIPKHHG